jgi:hypothetical protein
MVTKIQEQEELLRRNDFLTALLVFDLKDKAGKK